MSGGHPVAFHRWPLHLGDQWWVLDDTLRLYRELGEKKGREVLLLRDLKVSYPGFPEGPVFATETPDFLVETAGDSTMGLELVEVHRGGARRRGSRHRERQEAEETVLRLAEECYYAGAGGSPEPVYAYLSWPSGLEAERVGPLPRPTWELAGEVGRLVSEGVPTWAGGGRLELGPEELEGTLLEGVLHGISARRAGSVGEDGRGSLWGRTLSYAPATAGIPDLAREIAGKDRVYTACKEKCAEVWLVVALTRGSSSFEDADDAVLGHSFRSAFDRVVLLCPSSRRGHRMATLSVTE